MSILVLVEGQVQPDKVDDFKSFIASVIGGTRAYDGCEEMTFHINQDDATDFVFAERWASRAQYEAYLAWRTETGALEQVAALLQAEPSVRYFENTGI